MRLVQFCSCGGVSLRRVGSGRRPHVLPYPVVLSRGDTMTALLNFADRNSGPSPLRADLTFAGVRLLGK